MKDALALLLPLRTCDDLVYVSLILSEAVYCGVCDSQTALNSTKFHVYVYSDVIHRTPKHVFQEVRTQAGEHQIHPPKSCNAGGQA